MGRSQLLRTILPVGAGAVAGILLIYISFNYLYGSVVGLLGVAGPIGAFLIYAISSVFGLSIWYLVKGAVDGRWRRAVIIGMGAGYALALGSVVLLKSPGIREVNLDFGSLGIQVSEGPAAVWGNVLLFVPLGAILAGRLRGFWRPILAAALISFLFEMVQFVAALGIADVVDLACNVCGSMGGVVLCRLFGQHLEVAPDSGGHWLLLLRRTGDSGFESKIKLTLVCGVTTGLVVFLAALTVMGGGGAKPNTTVRYIEDPVLSQLPRGVSAEAHPVSTAQVDGIQALGPFEGSLEGDVLSLAGAVIVQCEQWKSATGDLCLGMLAYFKDECEDIALGHGVPVVVLSESKGLDESGGSVSLEKIYERYRSAGPFAADLTVRLQDGWMQVEKIRITGKVNLDPLDPVPFLSWDDYADLRDAESCAKPWLSVGGSSTTSLRGFVMGTAEFQEEGVWFATCAVKDDLRGCPIIHMVNADIDSTPRDWGTPSAPVGLTLRDEDSGSGNHRLFLVRQPG